MSKLTTIDTETLRAFKISCLARGIEVDASAERALTRGGSVPLTVHEYATTGGVTLSVGDRIYVNAPFDQAFGDDAEARLVFDGPSDEYRIQFRGEEFAAEALPLPGYLRELDELGRPVIQTVFSHADRVRVSPIYGCSFTCTFCDIPGNKYVRRPLEQLLMAMKVAQADHVLPVAHALISGGTPSRAHYAYFDQVCEGIVHSTSIPVDVMMPPREDASFVDRFSEFGVAGYAINLEVYDSAVARLVTPQKHRLGLDAFARTISRAVERTGGSGRVRSLILVGIEPEEKTLEAVEWLARLGCDPVLSPFRPTPGTPLADRPIPSFDFLERVLLRSEEIVERHGVKLGPRCIPCTNNSLTFPDSSGSYYFSNESNWGRAEGDRGDTA